MEDFIGTCKKSAINGMDHFLMVFSHIPDDKLTWTPTPTAKSALRIAAHTAVTAGNFARMLRDKKLPTGDDIPIIVARTAAAEIALTSRPEIESLLRKNTDDVIAALDTLTTDDVELTLDSSLGWSMPMTFLMNLAGWHATLHAGQIDYIQTCWDDQEIYFRRREE